MRCHHAGQLGQGRVPRAPASYAGALAADLAAQPHHLLYEGLRLPRGPARDPRERYGPYPVLAAPWGPLRSSEFPAPWPILDTRPHLRLRPRDYPRCNLGPSPGDLQAPSPFLEPPLHPRARLRGCPPPTPGPLSAFRPPPLGRTLHAPLVAHLTQILGVICGSQLSVPWGLLDPSPCTLCFLHCAQ